MLWSTYTRWFEQSLRKNIDTHAHAQRFIGCRYWWASFAVYLIHVSNMRRAYFLCAMFILLLYFWCNLALIVFTCLCVHVCVWRWCEPSIIFNTRIRSKLIDWLTGWLTDLIVCVYCIYIHIFDMFADVLCICNACYLPLFSHQSAATGYYMHVSVNDLKKAF